MSEWTTPEKEPPAESITGGVSIVSYVADRAGDQRLVPGAVWQPVNIVNQQAWREIDRQIERSRADIARGRVSRLHYYMIANQMDPGLLARYAGLPGWLVRLHLSPFFFRRMRPATLRKYCAVFNVTPAELAEGELAPPVYRQ